MTRSLLRAGTARKMQCWKGGDPFHKAHGMDVFEYNGTDPRLNKAFNRGMSEHSTITMKKILETYDGFEGIKTLVDVGGGIGASLHAIVSKYPSIKSINFDLPHVINNAPSYPGVEHVGGDMFQSVPKGDVIFMKWICHSFNDQHCLKFLKKCYESLPENGKVIVADCLHSDYPDASPATKLNVLLLAPISWSFSRVLDSLPSRLNTNSNGNFDSIEDPLINRVVKTFYLINKIKFD
ncbi:hypothetical protein GQ457_01G038910 [Hibiscus cannabinus]